MPEEKTDVIAEEEILDGKGGDDLEDPSTLKQDSQEKAGEAEKTAEKTGGAEPSEPDDLAGLKEGQSIPFDRFKKVITQRNEGKAKLDSMTVDLEEARGFINNPNVYRAILLTKGITDKKVQNEKLKEAGFEVKEETPESDLLKQFKEGLDLNTVEGWDKFFDRKMKHFGKGLIEPLQQKFSEKETNEWIRGQETQARKLSKDTFNLEFGKVGQDEKNPNTGIGKIWNYIQKYPEHARLGHVSLLRLALSEEGFKLGKQEGLNEAKEHNENLKASQMEDDSGQVREGQPDSAWSEEDLMRWHRKHAK